MDGYQEASEIDIIDLMFYCLKRWRCIVVCMVLLATIAGIYKYQAVIAENKIKNEQQLHQYTIERDEGKAGVEEESSILANPTSSAATYAVIGMIGGVCFACFLFCISYVLSGKLQNENNFQKKFDMPLLGVIRKKETKKKLFRFVDRWIGRLEEGPYARISRNEQIKIAMVNVQSAINRNEKKIKRVMLAGTVTCNDVIEICEELAEEIDGVTFSSYRQIVFQASALRKLEFYEGILFVEKNGESHEKLIKKEKELAVDRNVKVLGAIVC